MSSKIEVKSLHSKLNRKILRRIENLPKSVRRSLLSRVRGNKIASSLLQFDQRNWCIYDKRPVHEFKIQIKHDQKFRNDTRIRVCVYNSERIKCLVFDEEEYFYTVYELQLNSNNYELQPIFESQESCHFVEVWNNPLVALNCIEIYSINGLEIFDPFLQRIVTRYNFKEEEGCSLLENMGGYLTMSNLSVLGQSDIFVFEKRLRKVIFRKTESHSHDEDDSTSLLHDSRGLPYLISDTVCANWRRSQTIDLDLSFFSILSRRVKFSQRLTINKSDLNGAIQDCPTMSFLKYHDHIFMLKDIMVLRLLERTVLMQLHEDCLRCVVELPHKAILQDDKNLLELSAYYQKEGVAVFTEDNVEGRKITVFAVQFLKCKITKLQLKQDEIIVSNFFLVPDKLCFFVSSVDPQEIHVKVLSLYK